MLSDGTRYITSDISVCECQIKGHTVYCNQCMNNTDK